MQLQLHLLILLVIVLNISSLCKVSNFLNYFKLTNLDD